MTTIKCNQVLVNFKGEPLKDASGEIVLGTVLSNVCAGKVSNPTMGWVLGKKFATEESVDLKAEEVVFLKKEISEVCKPTGWMTAMIAGQLLEILDEK